MNIIEKIKSISNSKVYHTIPSTIQQINEAETTLSIKFPKEYKMVLAEYDSLSFYGTEWSGINVKSYANVINLTKNQRAYDQKFPSDCFVLEDLAIDGLLAICDEEGKVYSYQYGEKELWANSLLEYLDICIDRNN